MMVCSSVIVGLVGIFECKGNLMNVILLGKYVVKVDCGYNNLQVYCVISVDYIQIQIGYVIFM